MRATSVGKPPARGVACDGAAIGAVGLTGTGVGITGAGRVGAGLGFGARVGTTRIGVDVGGSGGIVEQRGVDGCGPGGIVETGCCCRAAEIASARAGE